jgi:hypothetical protein
VTTVGRFGAGFLVGALLAGLLLVMRSPSGSESTAAPTADTTSSTLAVAVAEVPFVEPGEVLIGSTALLPRGLEVEDGVAVFRYELAGIGPSLHFDEDSEHQGDVLMAPEKWRLTTGSGAVVEETIGPRDSSVQFQMPSAEDTVATIELVGWRVATPIGDRVELPIEKGAAGTFRSGTAVIETVLEQRTSTIVQIDFDRSGEDWQTGLPRPLEPGWRVTGRQDGGIQLIWDGDDAPDSVLLEDFGFLMREAKGNLLVVDEVGAR